jgi:2-methylcitrate dehydratase PrpD
VRATHGVLPQDIEQVECRIASREVPIVCEPESTKRTPQNDYDAKFSLPYAVACMLLRGHVDVDDFTPAAICDPALLALTQRIIYREDPDSDFPRRFPGWLRVRLRDGRIIEQREPINRGSVERPLTPEEVREKFRRNARRALPPERVEAAIAAVASLERQADVGALTASLVP